MRVVVAFMTVTQDKSCCAIAVRRRALFKAKPHFKRYRVPPFYACSKASCTMQSNRHILPNLSYNYECPNDKAKIGALSVIAFYMLLLAFCDRRVWGLRFKGYLRKGRSQAPKPKLARLLRETMIPLKPNVES